MDKGRTGRIEVIAGCMFAGKSEELYRRLRRGVIGKKTIRLFYPTLDDRHPGRSHGEIAAPVAVECVGSAEEIHERLLGPGRPRSLPDIVAIDEAQFLELDAARVLEDLADAGCRVIVSMLDLTSDCDPFGPAGDILALADDVVKLKATCADCGNEDATRSWRLDPTPGTVVTGGADKYIALCRPCYRRRDERR